MSRIPLPLCAACGLASSLLLLCGCAGNGSAAQASRDPESRIISPGAFPSVAGAGSSASAPAGSLASAVATAKPQATAAAVEAPVAPVPSTRASQVVASPPSTSPASRPTTQPARDPRIAEAIRKGVAYLVANQNADGSWGKATETRGFEVVASVPGSHDGFRVATTALAVMALREAGESYAHDKGLHYLIEHGESRRGDGQLLYNVWAHTYALQALAIEMQVNPDASLKPAMKKAAEYQLERLVRYETVTGGWNYYDFDVQARTPAMESTSFNAAAGLVALWQAKHAGIDVPDALVRHAFNRLEEMRTPMGSYLYSADMRFHPRFEANKMRGSLGRAQSCNYALWTWDSKKVGKAQVVEGLDWFFKDHAFIEMGRQRQYPHEAWYKTAPYYYYFGHYYAGLLLEKLGPEGKQKYGKQLAEVVVPHQEADGSWWDYAMWGYHKPYGTAFAVMTLLRCE